MTNQNLIPRLVLITAILALFIPIVLIEHEVLIQTHGTIAYPLDDAFINLTLAKNLAFEHVWGITKNSFSSVSTSLLYPFVLAIIYLVSGASVYVPLLVNVAAAIWFLVALQRWLIRRKVNPITQLLILIAVIYLTPLPSLVVSGMEYPLELLFTFLFISSLIDQTKKTYLYAALMLLSSYETLPILLIVCIVLIVRRRWWEAVKLLFFAVLPLYLFGLLSITHHNYFVPTPLILTHSLSHYFISVLIGCTVAIGAPLIIKTRNKWLVYPIPALLAIPLIIRSAASFRRTASDCVNVYTEQYQTAKFVFDYYYQDPVASTDLGAISFWSNERTRIVDLAGLFDLEVLNRKRIHNWTPASADSLSERMNANVAILHHSWSDADVEPYWYRIATWQMPGDSVSFYSIDRRFIEKLQTNMHAFEPKLPPGVTVHYFAPID
ncbi:MAG TPA: hypothetical protein VNV35_12150 [Puia sp.]|nr:hypothetical protein [Puia sp.]